MDTKVIAGFGAVHSLPSPPVIRSREEILVDITAHKLLSVCTKVMLLILDPNRRASLPSREKTIGFLENVDTVCDQKVRILEQNLKYFNCL